MTASLTLYTFPSATATDGKSWIPAVRFALISLGRDGSEVRFRSVIDHIEHHPDFPGWDLWGHSQKRGKPYPKAHRAITLAALKLKEQGEITSPRRGYYQLAQATETVSEEIVVVEPTPAPPVVDLPSSTAPVGVSVVPAVTRPMTDNLYNEDAFLARLDIEQTRCFGLFSERSSSCAGGPLGTLCQQAKMVRVGEMAAAMDNEFVAERAEEEARLAAEAEAAAQPVVSEDEEAPSTVEASDSAEAPAASEGVLPEGANRVDSLPFEVYCSGCNETIRRGDPAVHLPGRGAFHPQCATS